MSFTSKNSPKNYDNYEDLWNIVSKYEFEGLTKSALEEVEKINILSEKEENAPQILKSLLYKSKYSLILEEDAQLKIIEEFKTKIAKSNFPEKQLLENTLASMYWQYFNRNRYQIYNRTTLSSDSKTSDFRTWDSQTLLKETQQLFLNSLQPQKDLQQISIRDFNDILNYTDGSVNNNLRPTLFDLLAFRALEFFKTNESTVEKPEDNVLLDNPDFIRSFNHFKSLDINSKNDPNSYSLFTLKLFQELTKAHEENNNLEALIDIDLQRINYIKNSGVFDNKDQLLIKTLKASKVLFSANESGALYDFEIAQFYSTQANSYSSENTENRWKNKEAIAICNEIISNYPKSFAAEKATVLINQIKSPALTIDTENFIPINTPARFLTTYKNLNKLNFHFFKLSQAQYLKWEEIHAYDDQIDFIKKLKTPLISKEEILKNETDYQSHQTELLLPLLDNGIYLVHGINTEIGSVNAFSTFQVTNLALIHENNSDKHIFTLVNRTNTESVAKAKVVMSYQTSYNSPEKTRKFTTDKNGSFSVSVNEYYRSVNFKISTPKESLYVDLSYLSENYKSPEHYGNNTAFVFTDRSIYRPGQPLYFKGILLKSLKNKSHVLPNHKMKVTLRDVNYQVISTLDLVTNDFGSFNGEFTLPVNTLSGQFSVYAESIPLSIAAAGFFSVEEYKRPKFETYFKPVTETFQVNEEISVTGLAKAFAGSVISDAKVVYTVKRRIQYPYWCYWRSYYSSDDQEISHGETTTDEKGEYKISFPAKPDLSVDKNDYPIFYYDIQADVIDINGETRSSFTSVAVGYHLLLASVSTSSIWNKKQKEHSLHFHTTNLNHQFNAASGNVKIHKLTAPDYPLRRRHWSAPDYQILSKEEFKKLFPYEPYEKEEDFRSWEKGKLTFTGDFNTEKSAKLIVGNVNKWESGIYIIELESKDRLGQLVKDIQYFSVYDEKDKLPADNKLFSANVDKSTYSPSETVELTLASNAKDLTVHVIVEKINNSIERFNISLNKKRKTIKIPVTEKDLGGFAIHYFYSFQNDFQENTIRINVPHPSSALSIETKTFRDKLKPGTDETWEFKIKGPEGEKVSAELLASMYDASLDQFKPHYFSFSPISKSYFYSKLSFISHHSYGTHSFRITTDYDYLHYPSRTYNSFNWFDFYFGNGGSYGRSKNKLYYKSSANSSSLRDRFDDDALALEESEDIAPEGNAIPAAPAKREASKPSPVSDPIVEQVEEKEEVSEVPIRKNLQETAFFFPELRTDEEGNVSFSFRSPEALTKWNLQLLAHTKSLESSVQTLQTVTQKELMVIPNPPRFVREGDEIIFQSKIANLTPNELKGKAKLVLTNAVNGSPISTDLGVENIQQDFKVNAEGNTVVSWTLKIPEGIQAIQYQVIAQAGDFSDGEQNVLPALTNRTLVTETLPIWIKSNETRTFTLDKLKNNQSTTLKHHKLSLEMTSNPAWYAVQALPYLIEYPHECAEQTFSKYYSNALASHILNSNPKIKTVFDTWRTSDALISNLEKNQELKSLIIEETPWLRDAQSETEQKKRIALLFDLNTLGNQLASALNKVKKMQNNNGSWSWFSGGRPNRYITQHIVSGIGHLKQLGVSENDKELQNMAHKALTYLDQEFIKEYEWMKSRTDDLTRDHLSHTQLHYLYLRSFFTNIPLNKKAKKIQTYYLDQIEKYWLSRSLYNKGLAALILFRNDRQSFAKKILTSLKQNSITSEELGMYWKANTASWFWYQAPIETQSLLIEAFSEIENDVTTIDNLKIWLLKNKQTNRWATTKATTEAVYALLLQGSDWISVSDMVDVKLGDKVINPAKLDDVKVEAGTGYFKTSWSGSEISNDMATVEVQKKGNGIAWGGLYWQYFEDLDKITGAETPLKLKKTLFLKENTSTGKKIKPITADTDLEVGDLITVRIELRSDREMDFVHMKDLRASGLEPTNVFSRYKWQDGLGYYESTKDAATHFFFDHLPKGVFVFEYDLRVNNSGDFSNGITTIQSMYAPEFTSHSEGVRVKVK